LLGLGVIGAKPFVHFLVGQAELIERVSVRGSVSGARRRGQRADGVGRRAAKRQPEVPVDRLHRAHRIRHQVVVAHVMELRRVVAGTLRREQLEPGRPELQLIMAEYLTGKDRRPARGGLRRQAAHRGDRRPRRAVRLNHERVRIGGEQRTEREQMAGVLEHPAFVAVVQADHLQVPAVPQIRTGPVLLAEPGGIAGHMRQALERYRAHRLPQELPAFLHLVGGHVVHPHELGVLDMVPGVALLDVLEDRVVGPGRPGRAGLRHLGQPHLHALVGRVRREQPVQGRGAGPWQPGDEDRPIDRHPRVFRVRLPGRLAGQPGGQRPAQHRPLCLRPQRREPGLAGAVVKQNR
jgi:hypothetical protein